LGVKALDALLQVDCLAAEASIADVALDPSGFLIVDLIVDTLTGLSPSYSLGLPSGFSADLTHER